MFCRRARFPEELRKKEAWSASVVNTMNSIRGTGMAVACREEVAKTSRSIKFSQTVYRLGSVDSAAEQDMSMTDNDKNQFIVLQHATAVVHL